MDVRTYPKTNNHKEIEVTSTELLKPASPKQLKWLRDLVNTKDYSTFPADWRNWLDYVKRAFELCEGEGFEPATLNVWLATQERDQITMATFKSILPRLMEAPKAKGAQADTAADPGADAVPEGRYAVATEEGALNKLAFYKVDRPTEGKWAGYVFVKLMISDHEQRMSKAAGMAVLAKIAAVGAAKASAAYGQHFEHCGVCGRGLTNDTSREIGIGPDCRAKMGW